MSRPRRSQSSSDSLTPMRAGDGQQVHDRVGRAADRAVDHDRVLERLLGEDLRHLQVLVHHVDDPPPAHARQQLAPRIDGRNRGVGGQAHAERLDHRRHRRRRAHRHAMAGGARHARLGLDQVRHLHLAGLQHLGELPHVRAGADVLAAELAVQHRSTGYADRRQVARRRAHQQRRRGLVATHHQHDAVEGIGADRLLDVHRRLVAEQHRRGPHQRFAQAHHRKLDGEATGIEDAVAHVLRQFAEMRVARCCLRPRVADADDRPAVELVVRHALVLHPRAVDHRVAVVAREPGLRAEYALDFCRCSSCS